MTTDTIRTFFCFAYHEVTTAEQALALMTRIAPQTEVVFLQDSAKAVSAPVKRAVEARNGEVMRFRTSGPWNKLWKFIQGIEIQQHVTGKYREAGELCFISMIPSAEIHAAMKRHRVIANVTNRELFWIKSLAFDESHDEIIAMTLNSEMGYLTDKTYKDLTTLEAFELTAFEGLRFMRPCHDVQTCSSIMATYAPPKPKGELYIAPAPLMALPA